MKKASSSFLILGFAALLASTQSFAQRYNPRHDQVIEERVAQTLRSYQRMRLGDLMGLSHQEMNLEVRSLSMMAESLFHGPATLQLLHLGRPIASDIVRKNLKRIEVQIPAMVRISELELDASSDIFIDSISLEVERGGHQNPYPHYEQQVRPHQMITLQLNRHIRGHAQLPLKQLVKQQLGFSLEGAEIERVVVQADPMGARSASVQVELNNRLVGPRKFINRSVERMPLPIQSSEVVRNLQLVVNGEAFIQTVGIRVGQVRPQGPQFPQSSRIIVNRQIAPRLDLPLAGLMYDSRLVRSITIEAEALDHLQAQVALMGSIGFQGSVIIGPRHVRATLHLSQPMALYELKLEASSHVMIHALEIEFAR